MKLEHIYFFYQERNEIYSDDRVVPESCCLQKVLQQEICPCHSDPRGVTQCQIARCALGSDQ